MFAQVHTPAILTPAQLDDYLLGGWFRMGQNIFTTNFLNFKGNFYSAVWLRLLLYRYRGDKTHQKLSRVNSRFVTNINKAEINAEKEELFAKYRESITFEASSSLHQLMFGKASHDIYDTFEVTIRDDGRLVACGFFDLGFNSAAGITSFYDPEYKKHSLGKFLIYLKIQYCKDLGLTYFYPGYFVPGYSFFDYKLSIGRSSLEYLDFSRNLWLSVDSFSPLITPIRLMEDKLNSLQILLAQGGNHCELLRYEFFEASLLPELKDAQLFDYPLFLHYSTIVAESDIIVIVYDVREDLYHLIRCRSLWSSSLPNANGMFSSELLSPDQVIFSSSSAKEIVANISVQSNRGIDIW
jgi:leucyl-tRNA---protein transferase